MGWRDWVSGVVERVTGRSGGQSTPSGGQSTVYGPVQPTSTPVYGPVQPTSTPVYGPVQPTSTPSGGGGGGGGSGSNVDQLLHGTGIQIGDTYYGPEGPQSRAPSTQQEIIKDIFKPSRGGGRGGGGGGGRGPEVTEVSDSSRSAINGDTPNLDGTEITASSRRGGVTVTGSGGRATYVGNTIVPGTGMTANEYRKTLQEQARADYRGGQFVGTVKQYQVDPVTGEETYIKTQEVKARPYTGGWSSSQTILGISPLALTDREKDITKFEETREKLLGGPYTPPPGFGSLSPDAEPYLFKKVVGDYKGIPTTEVYFASGTGYTEKATIEERDYFYEQEKEGKEVVMSSEKMPFYKPFTDKTVAGGLALYGGFKTGVTDPLFGLVDTEQARRNIAAERVFYEEKGVPKWVTAVPAGIKGSVVGIVEDVREKPYKLPLYVGVGKAAGWGLGATGKITKAIGPKTAKTSDWITKLGGGYLGGVYAYDVGTRVYGAPTAQEKGAVLGVATTELLSFGYGFKTAPKYKGLETGIVGPKIVEFGQKVKLPQVPTIGGTMSGPLIRYGKRGGTVIGAGKSRVAEQKLVQYLERKKGFEKKTPSGKIDVGRYERVTLLGEKLRFASDKEVQKIIEKGVKEIKDNPLLSPEEKAQMIENLGSMLKLVRPDIAQRIKKKPKVFTIEPTVEPPISTKWKEGQQGTIYRPSPYAGTGQYELTTFTAFKPGTKPTLATGLDVSAGLDVSSRLGVGTGFAVGLDTAQDLKTEQEQRRALKSEFASDVSPALATTTLFDVTTTPSLRSDTFVTTTTTTDTITDVATTSPIFGGGGGGIPRKPKKPRKPKVVPPIIPPPLKEPPIKQPKKKVKKAIKQGYHPEVKEKGEWKRVVQKPRTKKEALALAGYIVDNSTAVQMRLIKAKKNAIKETVKRSIKKDKFRDYSVRAGKKTPLPNQGLIEVKRNRIDTRGEKQQLSAAKVLKSSQFRAIAKPKRRRAKATKPQNFLMGGGFGGRSQRLI